MVQHSPLLVDSLRALTYRISSTPVKELPSVAPQIASSIWNCKDLLCLPADVKQASDVSTTVQRFKTQLSTLLQDRTTEGRWSAIVLVKAAIEAGGLEVLSKCNAWVRSLLGFLKRPDPTSTRVLTIITLTRIFMLTWDYSNLVREITTPALTALVPVCLANIEHKRCSAKELQTVLESFATLLPRHPTIFRTYESKLRLSLLTMLSASSSNVDTFPYYTENHKAVIRRVLVLLHHCAPKQGAAERWQQTLNTAVEAAHSTCDRIFRSVNEDWRSVAGIPFSTPSHILSAGEVGIESDDLAGMKPWKGVYAGTERVVQLLSVITSHLETATASTVSFRLGLVTDLLARLFELVPQAGKQDSARFNNQVGKDERDAMFSALQRIHLAATSVSNVIVKRFGSTSTAALQTLLDSMSFVFKAQKQNTKGRETMYIAFAGLLHQLGPSLSKSDVGELSFIIKSACRELLPDEGTTSSSAQPNAGGAGIKQQLGLTGGETKQTHATDLSPLQSAAQDLLRAVLQKLEAAFLSAGLRAQIDRTAVLVRDHDLMLASVMNPSKKPSALGIQSSLISILAREYDGCPEVEALLRPRMPVIRTGKRGEGDNVANGEDEDDQEDEEESEENGEDADRDDVEEKDQAATPDDARNVPSRTSNIEMAAAAVMETLNSEQTSSKRGADEDESGGVSTKRIRTSPVSSSVLPDNTLSVESQEESAAASTNASTAHWASPQLDIPSSKVVDVGMADVLDSDGDSSDIELPVLAMESDTDPEDNE